MDITSNESLNSETAFEIGSCVPGIILGVVVGGILGIMGALRDSNTLKVSAVIAAPVIFLMVTGVIHFLFRKNNRKTVQPVARIPFQENVTKYCTKCRKDTEWFVGEDGTLLCHQCVSRYETQPG